MTQLADSLMMISFLAVLTFPAAIPASGQVSGPTGSIAGQVTWCAARPVALELERGGPLPMMPSLAPDVQFDVSPEPSSSSDGATTGQDRVPTQLPAQLAPAGDILVAIQGTSLSARTDDSGRFRIDNVPVGLYFTLAAGPVRGAPAALAMQPNVIVETPGAVADAGIVSLAANCGGSPVPLGRPAEGSGAMDNPVIDVPRR